MKIDLLFQFLYLSMLCIKQKIEFTFNLSSLELIQIETTSDNTFLLLVIEKQSNNEVILHISFAGHIINKYPLESSINYIAMISSCEVAAVMAQLAYLLIVDLEESKTNKIAHNSMKQAIDNTQLFVFPLSSLFCISEYNTQKRNDLKLTYYSQKDKNIDILYEQHDKQLQNVMFVTKLDNRSQMGWYIRNYKNNYEQIVIHDIIVNHELKRESRVRKVKIKDLTFIGYQKTTLLSITKMWRFRKDQYLICISPEDQEDTQFQFHDFLIVNNQTNSIMTSKFSLSTNSLQSLITVHFSQEFLHVISRKWNSSTQNNKVTSFVIDNKNEKIIKTQQEIDIQKVSFFYPSYDYKTILKAYYSQNLNKIELCIDKILNLSQVYLHFLLGINENFDDDLLQDSLQLLSSEEQK